MSMMKKLSVLTAVFVLASGVNTGFAADDSASAPKVAVVNVQDVLKESTRVQAARKKLEADFKNRQTKINSDQSALETELKKFQKESVAMSAKDKEAMQKKMKDEKDALVKQFVAYNQDLQKAEGQAMQDILKDLNNIVTTIAKNKNYTLVLDAQAVLFSNGEDITKDVSAQFNKK